MRSRTRQHLVPSSAVALIGALAVPALAGAQTSTGPAAMPAPDDTVRVSWTDAGRHGVREEGVVTEAGAGVIYLRTSSGIEAIPADAVTSVEFGHRRTGWEGFKRGFTIGGIVGGLAGIVIGGAEGASCEGDFLCPGPAGGAAILGTMFGVGGGVLAGLVKAASPGIEWSDAPVRATTGLAPGGGTELGIRVSF